MLIRLHELIREPDVVRLFGGSVPNDLLAISKSTSHLSIESYYQQCLYRCGNASSLVSKAKRRKLMLKFIKVTEEVLQKLGSPGTQFLWMCSLKQSELKRMTKGWDMHVN